MSYMFEIFQFSSIIHPVQLLRALLVSFSLTNDHLPGPSPNIYFLPHTQKQQIFLIKLNCADPQIKIEWYS